MHFVGTSDDDDDDDVDDDDDNDDEFVFAKLLTHKRH